MSRPTLNGILSTYQNPNNDTYVSHLGQNVLSKERDLLKQLWPNELNDIRWARDTARDTANERYPNGNMPKDIKGPSAAGWNNTDGHRDAFRHALWGALTAREMERHRPDGRGTMWAENFLYAHEGRANNNKTQEAMDLYNNNVGFKIYRENPKASPEKLADLVENAVKNGQMVVINKQGNLNWSDKVPLYQHGSAEHPVKNTKKAMGDDGIQVASLETGAPVARAANVLVDGNDRLNNQFAQAMNGSNGNRDTAALAVQTISQAQGYRETENIKIIEGKNGLVVSQGDGATSINVPMPASKAGDFERIAAQLAQTQPAQSSNPQVVALEQTQDQTRKSQTV